MGDFISREAAIKEVVVNSVKHRADPDVATDMIRAIEKLPAADVVDEENILKFYYVRSIDEYWIGRRIDNFYYAEYDASCGQWVWTHSRYLPWGEHVVAPNTLWKEHTYPSKPEEIPFGEWLTGFIKKHSSADVVEVRHGRWEERIVDDDELDKYGFFRRRFYCSACGNWNTHGASKYCPNCGAVMMEES